ncbi:hypothetical protein ACROYT_G027463 [Oculina patagonica]
MSGRTLRITLLADEWKSTKGGLSTINRELAIQLAKHPKVRVTFFVPKCAEDDKKAASIHNISIVKAKERPGFESIDWLCFPPGDLAIDIIIGHGVKLGRQAQVIRESHNCTWVQVVHTAPDKLAMFKDYSGAISKGDGKQWTEVNLCKIADLVVAVGPKLYEVYSRYLSSSGKNVFNLTPGIFAELSGLKPSTQGRKEFWVLAFGRGDKEDFELKGFDIAAKAVAELNDRSCHLVFVGAPIGNEEQVADKLLEQGLRRSQLTVKGYLENRDDLATQLSTANLAIIPSRTEGFGLTALEALSAGLPFLVSQNSGFGEALQEIPTGSSWIVDSEDPEQWAEAIKGVRGKGIETAIKECQELRTRYAEKYSWEKQCNDLVEMLIRLVNVSGSAVDPEAVVPSQNRGQTEGKTSEKGSQEEQAVASSKVEGNQAVLIEIPEQSTEVLKDKLEMPLPESVSAPGGKQMNGQSIRSSRQASTLQEDQPAAEQRRECSSSSDISQGARPKEMTPSRTGRTKLEGEESSIQQYGLYNSVGQRGEGNLFSRSKSAEQRRDDQLFGFYDSAGQRREQKIFSRSNTYSGEQRKGDSLFSPSNEAGGKELNTNNEARQRREDSSFSRSKSAEQRREDSSFRSFNSAEQRGEERLFIRSNTYSGEQRRKDSSFHRSSSAEQRRDDQLYGFYNSAGQRGEGNLFNRPNSAEQRREDSSFSPSNTYSAELRREHTLFSPSNIAELRRENSSFSPSNTYSAELRREDTLFSPSNSAELRREDSSFSPSHLHLSGSTLMSPTCYWGTAHPLTSAELRGTLCPPTLLLRGQLFVPHSCWASPPWRLTVLPQSAGDTVPPA